MNKGSLLFVLILSMALSGAAFGQEKVITEKQVTVHPDGSYTVIEYPVGREVTVNLLPGPTVAGGKGVARVIRSADGTKIYLDVSGVPATTTGYYAYAVDPSGKPTLLGPVTFQNGVGKAEFATPMSQFMLVLSPRETLTVVEPTTMVFHSEVPTGFVVVPKSVSENRVVETANPAAVAAYNVPLLNVPSFGDTEKELKLKFTGELEGLEAKAYLDREGEKTKVKMRFDDMKKVPANKRLTLWASSPEGTYTKLGQVINTGAKSEAEIQSETSLSDFGLFVTVEDADVRIPTSKVYSVFTVPSS